MGSYKKEKRGLIKFIVCYWTNEMFTDVFMQDIISDSHKQLLHDVKTFVSDNADIGSSIPTAFISLGVNLPGIYN